MRTSNIRNKARLQYLKKRATHVFRNIFRCDGEESNNGQKEKGCIILISNYIHFIYLFIYRSFHESILLIDICNDTWTQRNYQLTINCYQYENYI